jgi:hypothetical protein
MRSCAIPGMTFSKFGSAAFQYGRGAFAYHRVRAARRFRSIQVLAFYKRLATMPFATDTDSPIAVSLLALAQERERGWVLLGGDPAATLCDSG